MTREEIISKGVPIEPNCFETDREEQWYKAGLYDGATASPWHDVKEELPNKSNGCECNQLITNRKQNIFDNKVND